MNADSPPTQSSVLSPQSSADEPGELAAVGALLLVGALVACIFIAMSSARATPMVTCLSAVMLSAFQAAAR